MATIPCMHPESCGVTVHQLGSAAARSCASHDARNDGGRAALSQPPVAASAPNSVQSAAANLGGEGDSWSLVPVEPHRFSNMVDESTKDRSTHLRYIGNQFDHQDVARQAAESTASVIDMGLKPVSGHRLCKQLEEQYDLQDSSDINVPFTVLDVSEAGLHYWSIQHQEPRPLNYILGSKGRLEYSDGLREEREEDDVYVQPNSGYEVTNYNFDTVYVGKLA